MNKGSKIVISVTASMCLAFLLLGLYSGPSFLNRGGWTDLEEADGTVHSWGGKGQVSINDQQYNIEGHAIVQGGEDGSIKVEADWHKPHEQTLPSFVTTNLNVKVKGDKQKSFLQRLTNHRKGGRFSDSAMFRLPQGDTIGEDGGEGQDATDEERAFLEKVERILNGEGTDEDYPFRNGKYVGEGSENDSQQNTKQPQQTTKQQKATKQQQATSKHSSSDPHPECFKDNPKHFSLSRMVDNFKKVMTKGGEIDTVKYINAHSELLKFFTMMGTLFTFVTSEAQTKIDYLNGYLSSPDGKKYATLESMVKFETDNHIINVNDYEESGTRNFLRLHRGLNFSLAFCEALKTSAPGDSIIPIASASYFLTVAHFHGWFMRKAVQAAFYLLPSRDEFMGLLCDTDEDTTIIVLNQLAAATKPVYDRTQYIFTKYNYLDLP